MYRKNESLLKTSIYNWIHFPNSSSIKVKYLSFYWKLNGECTYHLFPNGYHLGDGDCCDNGHTVVCLWSIN